MLPDVDLLRQRIVFLVFWIAVLRRDIPGRMRAGGFVEKAYS